MRLNYVFKITQFYDIIRHNILFTVVAPAEILAQGQSAVRLYEKALEEGYVKVHRARILIIGQDRAGKTSLKKSLLGLPFNPKEQSTEGIEIDPSKCEIDVDLIKNWHCNSENNTVLSDATRDISRLLAEERYHAILSEGKEDLRMESKGELSTEELMDSDAQFHLNKVRS